jgi:hypothetical protein
VKDKASKKRTLNEITKSISEEKKGKSDIFKQAVAKNKKKAPKNQDVKQLTLNFG